MVDSKENEAFDLEVKGLTCKNQDQNFNLKLSPNKPFLSKRTITTKHELTTKNQPSKNKKIKNENEIHLISVIVTDLVPLDSYISARNTKIENWMSLFEG